MTLSKYSLAPVVRRHFVSMADDPDAGKPGRSVWLVLVASPVVLGAFAGGLVAGGLDVRDGVSQALAATSLLVGAMLSLFVFITNLRVKVAESPTYAFRVRMQQLLGGTAAGCMYVALAALVVAAELALTATISVLRNEAVQPFTVAVVVASLAHLGLNLLNVMRRLFGTYFELFASDFDPRLNVVPDAVDAPPISRVDASAPASKQP